MAKRKKTSPVKPDLSHIAQGLRSLAVPIATLRADPDNARLHDDRNLASIVASLQRFGQQAPVVYTTAPGRKTRTVRKGNGVLAAARQLGWTHLAAVASDLAGKEAKAFAPADNRAGDFRQFDPALLVAQLQELEEAEINLDAMGFDDDELDALLELVEEPPGRVVPAAGDPSPRKRGARMMGFVCGQFHFEVPRETYDAWLADIEAKVSSDPDRIVRELKRRLKLLG